MFNKLKEKFSSWVKKSEKELPELEEEKKENITEEPIKEELDEKKESFLNKIFKKKEKKEEAEQTEKKEEEIKQELPKKTKKSLFRKKKKEILEEKLKDMAEEIKEEVPQKFETGLLSYQPDMEAIKEKTDSELLENQQEIETIKEKTEVEQLTKKEPLDYEKKEDNFFSKLAKKLSSSKLTKKEFDNLFDEFEITLLENNVALEAVDEIRKTLSEKLIGVEIKKKEVEEKIISSLKETINSILIEPPNLIKQIKEKQGVYTIIFFGINGSGKTTSISKLASYLKENKISCIIGAADTFRAASIEQLKKHGENLNIKVISNKYGVDPASVAFDTIKHAKANNVKVALIDTAGRMYTQSNLMKEMEKIVRISNPDLKIFVGESITGNDAIEQAKSFNDSVGIDGIVLTKADVDEKAGTILSVSLITKKPIYFLGTGQKYSDFTPFTKKEILKNLGLE